MRRREFITFLGGVAAWPLTARAQQPAMPVVGFLGSESPSTWAQFVAAFREGLRQTGYAEGRNVAIEYRWADGQNDRFPSLAADLVARQVTVIAAPGSLPAILAAKAATATIPIIFLTAVDPIELGLVASLARPGGNLTGINFFNAELVAKRLELLRELVPGAVRVAVLVNPANEANSASTLRDVEVAARSIGVELRILNASTSREIDAAFATFVDRRPDALFVANDPFFTSRRVQLANLAARHAIPMSSGAREIAEVGGVMGYGSNIVDAYRQVGLYVGRILTGTKPTELAVIQSSKFELVINAQTARILGLEIPPMLLARADEVIE